MSSWRQAGLKYVAANKHLFIRVKVKRATEKRATEKNGNRKLGYRKLDNRFGSEKMGRLEKRATKIECWTFPLPDISPIGHFPYRGVDKMRNAESQPSRPPYLVTA